MDKLTDEKMSDIKESSVAMMSALMMITEGPNEAISVLALMSSYLITEHSNGNVQGSLDAYIEAVKGLVENNPA